MRSASHPRNGTRGVILLEVMLAVAIFCLVGLALAKAISVAAGTLSLGNRQTSVRLALEGELSSALSQSLSTAVVIGLQATKTTDDGIAYEREWQPCPTVTSDKTLLDGLYLLTARARWTENGKDQVQEATIRVFHPKQ